MGVEWPRPAEPRRRTPETLRRAQAQTTCPPNSTEEPVAEPQPEEQGLLQRRRWPANVLRLASGCRTRRCWHLERLTSRPSPTGRTGRRRSSTELLERRAAQTQRNEHTLRSRSLGQWPWKPSSVQSRRRRPASILRSTGRATPPQVVSGNERRVTTGRRTNLRPCRTGARQQVGSKLSAELFYQTWTGGRA